MNKNNPFYIFNFIILISIFFGIAISAVHFLTEPMMEKNEALHKNRIIAQSFMLNVEGDSPEAYQAAINDNIRQETFTSGGEKIEVLVNFKTGMIGFIFDGMGFWEPISGVVVLDENLEKIKNLKILEQKETPGLGARIEEQWFTEQFKNLNVKWQAEQEKIIIGSTSSSDTSNVVDAITGASQTSMALMRMLNEDLQKFKKISNKL